jgi:hypothetical protein
MFTLLSVAWVLWSQIKDRKQDKAAEGAPKTVLDVKEDVG